MIPPRHFTTATDMKLYRAFMQLEAAFKINHQHNLKTAFLTQTVELPSNKKRDNSLFLTSNRPQGHSQKSSFIPFSPSLGSSAARVVLRVPGPRERLCEPETYHEGLQTQVCLCRILIT